MSLRWLLPLCLWFLPADVHSADITLRCTTERRVDVQPDPRSQDQAVRVKMPGVLLLGLAVKAKRAGTAWSGLGRFFSDNPAVR